MTERYFVRETKAEDFAEIRAIADKQLGKNYLVAADLQRILQRHTATFSLSAVERASGSVVGYCLSSSVDYKVAEQICRRDVSELHGTTLPVYIETLAVDPQHNGKGIGSQLISATMERCREHGVGALFGSAWKQRNKINVGNLLLRNGFRQLEEIPDYWLEQSIREGFICPECGNPCHCSCVLFIKNDL